MSGRSIPFLGLTTDDSDAMTLLWTVLRGGPAIRVNSRRKQLNSRWGCVDRVVMGALAFTDLTGLVFDRVTGAKTTCSLLLAQLKARRCWVIEVRARRTRL